MTRWSVWCEHADGRCYRMGDASETRWSQATAEGVAKHMTAYEVGTFVAQPCPSPTDFESAIAALNGPMSDVEMADLRRYLADPENDTCESHGDESMRRVFLTFDARIETMRKAAEFCGPRGTCPRCTAEDPDRYVDARPHDVDCMFAPPVATKPGV